MGYNRALVQDESVSFVVTFSSAEPGAALSVCGLKSGGLLLEKTVTRCAIEADRNPTRVKGANNVLVYRFPFSVLYVLSVSYMCWCTGR